MLILTFELDPRKVLEPFGKGINRSIFECKGVDFLGIKHKDYGWILEEESV